MYQWLKIKGEIMKDLIKEGKVIRICYVCRKELDLISNNFYKNSTKEKGFELCCKNCSKQRLSKYKPKQKDAQGILEYNVYKNNWRKKQYDKGLCKDCKAPRLSNSKRCEKHWLQDLSRKHLGTTKRWMELKSLLEQQNYKCIYSGVNLIMGENASVDHIKPLSGNPVLNHDINNLQWTTKQINLMKLNLSEAEFLNIIKSIYEFKF